MRAALTPAPAGKQSAVKKRLALAAAICGSGMAFLDGSAVNVALPAMQHDLNGGSVEAQWIVNAYLLRVGAFVLGGGAAGDRYGRRKVFLAGIGLFTLASIACASGAAAQAIDARVKRPIPARNTLRRP